MPSQRSQASGKVLGKRKKDQDATSKRHVKKPRKDTASSRPDSASGDQVVIERNPPKTSLLRQEEKSFPRGGADTLTPVERKQIQIQATKDVLFEESGRKRAADDIGSDGEPASDIENEPPVATKKSKPSKKKTKHTSETAALNTPIRTDGLKPSRLVPGCVILGKVSRIHANDVTIDLPNNLRGNVSITAVSKVLSERLVAIAEAQESQTYELAQDDDADLDPQTYFTNGQYLRVCVVDAPDAATKDANKGKKQIQLSVDPRQTNQGMSKQDIATHTMVQASIVSVEDHGLVMDLGIQDDSSRGFMSSREIPEDIQYSSLKPGAVFLCVVTGMSSNGSVTKLSANLKKAQKLLKSQTPTPPTVKSLLPGLAVEVLVSEVSSSTLSGKIMGSVDASADVVHSGAGSRESNIESKYKPGMKVKARIIFANPGSMDDVVGISMLDHILSLSPRQLQQGSTLADPLSALPISSVIEKAKVVNVEPGLGLFADVGAKGVPAFVHISKVSDGRVESLSQSTGAYRSGTSHRARIIGYNTMDGMFLASFEKSVLDQKYLRLEDIPLGEVLPVQIEEIVINASGVAGILVNISKGINGFVPEMHMSDIQLQHPERKFKVGSTVTARVLSVNPETRKLRLTLKKALVATDGPIWTNYEDITPGSGSVGTVREIKPAGAIVHFFGPVTAFLPTSQMSDGFIENPAKHFRVGQTLKVNVLTVDSTAGRMTVTCRVPSESDIADSAAFANLKAGQLVSGTVTEKSGDDITVALKDSKLKASLPIGHLSDGSERKSASALKHIRVGQSLQDLVIVELFTKKKSILVSNKPSLIRDVNEGKFVIQFDQINPHMKVNGFVRNISEDGVFVALGNGLTGLLHRTQIPDTLSKSLDYGLRKDQSLSAHVLFVDYAQSRFTLTMKEKSSAQNQESSAKVDTTPSEKSAENPIDGTSQSLGDFTIGKITSAKISSIKDTQLNVKLAENVQGRIDVSEAFTKWEDIKDRKNPLRAFRVNDTVPVRILGIHDARNHRFLPISHRSGKVPVFELSAKIKDNLSILSLGQLTVGSWHMAFVNNVSDSCLWMNVSPNVRGRIARMDISEDVSVLNDLASSYPIGSALRVRVKKIDLLHGRLDLSAREEAADSQISYDSLAVGMITSGRVTRVTERNILVQLGPTIVGSVSLTELADDFSQADPNVYTKNDIVKVCILDIDRPNKKVTLSTRPSRVLSSSLKVKDRYIPSIEQLKINDVVRGFVKNVADAGVFVALSHNVTAFVRVSELSDSFIKDWKASFEIDKLVTGKVIGVDTASKHVQLSLKSSAISGNYMPRLTFNDMSVGQIVTARVRKVEEFGVFIVVDNSQNVSGLCHRSEMAEQRVEDARKIYEEGDVVKAKVLKIEPAKRRISFGLKASYFENASENGSEPSDEDALGSKQSSDLEEDSDVADNVDNEGGVELPLLNGATSPDRSADSDGDEEIDKESDADDEPGLDAGGFDWAGAPDPDEDESLETSDNDQKQSTSRKRRSTDTIEVDHTGDLDAMGPRSANDFERLLLGQRDSSSLWVQYMAFYLQLSEVDEARKVAERALKEISIREQEEKSNVWVAYLNLENTYGTDDTTEDVFTQACEVNDAQEMHERLTSIYIESGKPKKADDLFQAMTKRKAFTPDPKLWLNYANFLIETLAEPDRGRALLDRAMKSVPSHLHRDLVSKFAQLEFKCKNGDPERGRTMFERLLDTYPKRWDLWDILVDMESLKGARANIRSLYERMALMKMKSKRAKYVFKRWLEFEEAEGDQKKIDHVKAKAAEYVEQQKARKGDDED